MATRRTHAFAGDRVTVDLITDDVRHRMIGITVTNRSDEAIRIEIPSGRAFTVARHVTVALPFIVSDERDIEAKSNGSRQGRPFRVAYPWF